MEIYYYCSYTGSPVGFQLGRLDCEKLAKNAGSLSKDGILPLIKNCFDQGLVRRACGRIPETEQYVLLVKGLTAKGTGDRATAEYYINFAFLMNKEEWDCLPRENLVDQQMTAEMFRDSMQLDSESPFGYTVQSGNAQRLTQVSFQNFFDRSVWKTDSLCLELLSPKADLKELKKVLGLEKDEYKDYEFQKLPSKDWVQFSKKKVNRLAKWWPLVAAAAIFLLFKLLNR